MLFLMVGWGSAMGLIRIYDGIMLEMSSEHARIPVAEGSARSADGTRIGFHRLGSGPAVVLVHGSLSTHTDWMRVARLLSPHYTCFVMERRGRGRSGAGLSAYSIEREYEDIAAMLSVAGEDASLAGHSYGAIGALGAAMWNPVRRLVLYEPPLPTGGPIAGEYLKPYAQAVAEGNLDAALEIGLTHFMRIGPNAIDAMRSSRAWASLRKLAPSWTRELEAMDSFSCQLDRFNSLPWPVLMLVGELSPEHPMRDASRALAQALPEVRVEQMARQDHMALRNAPELVARLIHGFLSETPGAA